MTPPTSPRPYSSRFSLRTLFVVVLIVALGVALSIATRELLELRVENARLRAEAGHLSVTDPEKVAVLAIRTLDELTWRWKVHLPAGSWVLYVATRNIPQTGLPDPADPSNVTNFGGITTNSIELPIDASVRKSASGQWQVAIRFQGEVRSGLPSKHALEAPCDKFWDNAGKGLGQSFDPDQPIVLLRLRAGTTPPSPPPTSSIPTTPCDGLMVWLERRKN